MIAASMIVEAWNIDEAEDLGYDILFEGKNKNEYYVEILDVMELT